MTTSNSTTDLLRQARNGDLRAQERLLAKYRDKLRRMINARMDARLAARLDCSDVVQDACMEASRRMHSFLEKGDDLFYPWLRAIAWERLVQLSRQHIGAQKRSVLREVVGGLQLSSDSAVELTRQIAASISTPSVIAARRELQQRIRDHLEHLSPADREVLILRHVELLSMNEVAVVVGVSLPAAQSRYRRALERLHNRIADERWE